MKTTTFNVQSKTPTSNALNWLDVVNMCGFSTEALARLALQDAKQMFPGMYVRLVKREEEVIG